jgi:hypothetical protein
MAFAGSAPKSRFSLSVPIRRCFVRSKRGEIKRHHTTTTARKRQRIAGASQQNPATPDFSTTVARIQTGERGPSRARVILTSDRAADQFVTASCRKSVKFKSFWRF